MNTVDARADDRPADVAFDANQPGSLSLSLNLAELRLANLARAKEWNPTGKDLGGPFAACELAGEVGEAIEAMSAALGLTLATGAICNASKKAERARVGIAGGTDPKIDLGRELADVVICADLIAMRLGVDLGTAVVEKFNLTSRERGFRTRMAYRFVNSIGVERDSIASAQRDALLDLGGLLGQLFTASVKGIIPDSLMRESIRAQSRCDALGMDTRIGDSFPTWTVRSEPAERKDGGAS